MPSISYRSSQRSAASARRGARVVAAGAAMLPLLALTFATLETAIVFTTDHLLRAVGAH